MVWGQMVDTVDHGLLWQVIFVPDSPTASLFFSLALLLLLYPPRGRGSLFQQFIEALAVVTSVKYGIWAVAIIFAGQAQGDVLAWQDWMLVASHTAMAVEALLFVRLFHYRWTALTGAIAWTLLNDTVDYTYGVFPWRRVNYMMTFQRSSCSPIFDSLQRFCRLDLHEIREFQTPLAV